MGKREEEEALSFHPAKDTLRPNNIVTMGGSSSKPEEDTDKSQGKEEIIEQSTGFHIVEIHLPTVNKGLGFLVLVCIAAVLLVWAHRVLRKKMKARERREATRGTTNQPGLLPLTCSPSEMGQRPGMYAWGRSMPAPGFFGWPPADVHVGRNTSFGESRFQEVDDDDVEEGNTGTWRRGTSAPTQSRARPMP